MQYRIDIKDERNRATGVLLLEFDDDAAALQFAQRIAKETKDRRIELRNGDRLIKVHPILRLVKGEDAANQRKNSYC